MIQNENRAVGRVIISEHYPADLRALLETFAARAQWRAFDLTAASYTPLGDALHDTAVKHMEQERNRLVLEVKRLRRVVKEHAEVLRETVSEGSNDTYVGWLRDDNP